MLAGALKNCLLGNGRELLGKVTRPRALCLYVTYKCNLRCQTCGIWKTGNSTTDLPELSASEFSVLLADPLFARLEALNLNGGEPLLRNDLPEISRKIVEVLPRLRSLSLNSNGLLTSRCLNLVKYLNSLCRGRGINFSVSISLHAPGKLLDDICGLPGTWEKVRATMLGLRLLAADESFFLSANCVLSSLNLDQAGDMLDWSKKEGIAVNFVLAEVRERFFNRETAPAFVLRDEQRSEAAAFFRRLAARNSGQRHHRLRYRVLADMLEFNRPRRLACHYRLGGAILGSRAELYYCKFSREIGNCRERPASEIYYDPQNLEYRRRELLGQVCTHCPPNTFNRQELEKDLPRYLAFLALSGLSREKRHG